MHNLFGPHVSSLLALQLLPDEAGQPLHGHVELVLGGDAEGGPQVLAGLAGVRLEGAARHQHDVPLEAALRDE